MNALDLGLRGCASRTSCSWRLPAASVCGNVREGGPNRFDGPDETPRIGWVGGLERAQDPTEAMCLHPRRENRFCWLHLRGPRPLATLGQRSALLPGEGFLTTPLALPVARTAAVL